MATKTEWLNIADLRAGRNGNITPLALAENEVADAVNVEWFDSLFARRRNGATALSMANSTFTGVISSLGRHVPDADDTQAELWATDDAATPNINRLAGGTNWTAPTLKDAPTGNGWQFSYASLNGLLFIAYKSAVNRLHVWDGLTVRRAGFAVPATPTANNQGSGSYAATTRYYRVRWTRQESGVTVRRSEPSASVAFTPSGTGASARIARPTVADEGETHWEVEASTDNATFYVLTAVATATSTYDDAAAPSTYTSNPVSASAGTYRVQPSYRFIAVDDNRLLGFGSHDPSDKQNRVEFSAVVGELNIGDAERVYLENRLDLDEKDSGAATGLKGPIDGSFFAFKYRQLWKLTKTGDANTPYTKDAISKTVGSVGPEAICEAEDEFGRPALYWMSDQGPYRWGAGGLEYIGAGIADLIDGRKSRLNTSASKVIAHTVFHAEKRQVWFYISVGSDNEPSLKLVYNIGRAGSEFSPSNKFVPSGWSQHTGESAKARASVRFSNDVGTTMSRRLKPYIAYSGANNAIWKCDADGSITDNGTEYQAFIRSRAYVPWGLMRNGTINRSYLHARAAANVTIQQSIVAEFGTHTTVSNVNLTPEASETRVRRRFEDSQMADVATVQFVWGDPTGVSAQWQMDAVTVEWSPKEVG